jgi:HEAT repeat protein
VRDNLTVMSRALAVIAACLVLCARVASADTIEQNVKQLANGGYKVRLAAALALAKSKDPRAVIALADALGTDNDATIRRVSALALEQMVDERTEDDAKELAIDALQRAAKSDKDERVKASAAAAMRALSGLKRGHAAHGGGDRPEVFVTIEASDQSKQAPSDAPARLTKVVKAQVAKTGYATDWPGGLPTQSELTSSRSRAFIVASTVKKVEVTRTARNATVACTVSVRIAPWTGTDGGEKWEANKAASAQGSAKAQTGTSQREIDGGVRDCLEAVAEDVTSRQVVPFLKRLAQAGS